MRNLFMTETRNTYLAITRAKLGFVTTIFSLLRNFLLTSFPIGVRAGGPRGAEAPQILRNSDFLGSKRKFGQSQFLKR